MEAAPATTASFVVGTALPLFARLRTPVELLVLIVSRFSLYFREILGSLCHYKRQAYW